MSHYRPTDRDVFSPGATDTDMTSTEEKQTLRMTPLSRLGTAEEDAAADASLASEDARWVTGERRSPSEGA